MTENRKQELSQLLGEAMEGLEIRDEYGVSLSLPEDLYREYLQESWRYYGLDCFSPYWIRLSLDIVSEKTKSRLLDFIREELTQFLGIGGDTISATTCLIESTSTDCPSVCRFDKQHIHLDLIWKRLLDIALVRGIAEVAAVLACAALEDSLKQCANSYALNVDDKEMGAVVSALKSEGVIAGPDGTSLKGFAQLRNKAFHAQWDAIDIPHLQSLLAFTEAFLVKHFSDKPLK